MNQLKILSLKFSTSCKKDCKIHQHMGNTLRGALGNTLKWLYDGHNQKKDIYDYIFKNQTESVYASSFVYGKANPFVIDCDYRDTNMIKANEKLIFNITLFGNACGYASDIIEAVKFMMEGNISNNIDCFELNLVVDTFTNDIYFKDGLYQGKIEPVIWSDTKYTTENIHKIKINFLSPVVLKSKGKLLNHLRFEDFLGAIIRRLLLLFSAYEDNEFIVDIDKFKLDLNKVVVKNSSLKFFNFDNYSRTIDNNYPRKGLVGFVEYEGDLNMFLPYINIGSVLHIGKGTTIGMGKYFFDFV